MKSGTDKHDGIRIQEKSQKTHTEYDATNQITLEKDENYCEL